MCVWEPKKWERQCDKTSVPTLCPKIPSVMLNIWLCGVLFGVSQFIIIRITFLFIQLWIRYTHELLIYERIILLLKFLIVALNIAFKRSLSWKFCITFFVPVFLIATCSPTKIIVWKVLSWTAPWCVVQPSGQLW